MPEIHTPSFDEKTNEFDSCNEQDIKQEVHSQLDKFVDDILSTDSLVTPD